MAGHRRAPLDDPGDDESRAKRKRDEPDNPARDGVDPMRKHMQPWGDVTHARQQRTDPAEKSAHGSQQGDLHASEVVRLAPVID